MKIKKIRKDRISNITKLQFRSVEKIMRNHIDKDCYDKMRLGKGAIIYLTAVLDKIIETILIVSNEDKRVNIIYTDNIINSCKYDENLKKIYYGLFI
jgi:histone H3/H4